MCGIYGLVGNGPEDLEDVIRGLTRVNHRGHGAVGISATNGAALFHFRHQGYVRDACTEGCATFRAFAQQALDGGAFAFVGHTRDATVGPSDEEHGQPVRMQHPRRGPFVLAHNGQVPMHRALRSELETKGFRFHTQSDSEVLAGCVAASDEATLPGAVRSVVARVPGVFSLLALDRAHLVAARDRIGNRPLWTARASRVTAFASEVPALPVSLGEPTEVAPGSLVAIDLAARDTAPAVEQVTSAEPAYCIFEALYFARPDQRIGSAVAGQIRRHLGARLAAERPVDADLVCGVPDSGTDAALGFSLASGLPYQPRLLVKNWYEVPDRSFILPGQQRRERAARGKYAVTAELARGQRVCIVDDTLVRGNTAPVLTAMLRAAGATEVHWRIAAAPIRYPCFYGIDIPTMEELPAAWLNEADICQHVGADSLRYLPYDSMCAGVEEPTRRRGWCTACFSGRYPIPVPGAL